MAGVRLDRWLCAARVYKSRANAQDAIDRGKVKVNGSTCKPSHAVQLGDELVIQKPRALVVLRIAALAEKRQSPTAARALYEDLSPPPPLRPSEPVVERGQGRPTKRDRRSLERLKRKGW